MLVKLTPLVNFTNIFSWAIFAPIFVCQKNYKAKKIEKKQR